MRYMACVVEHARTVASPTQSPERVVGSTESSLRYDNSIAYAGDKDVETDDMTAVSSLESGAPSSTSEHGSSC